MDNLTTAKKGMHATCKKIEQLGGTNIAQSKDGNRRFMTFSSPKGREYKITVRAKSRSSYKWQTKTTYGKECEEPPHESEYWIFVDLEANPPKFYPVPLWWISNNIYEVFQKYLRKNGGRRPGNDDSTHHAVELEHIGSWEEQWENLGKTLGYKKLKIIGYLLSLPSYLVLWSCMRETICITLKSRKM